VQQLGSYPCVTRCSPLDLFCWLRQRRVRRRREEKMNEHSTNLRNKKENRYLSLTSERVQAERKETTTGRRWRRINAVRRPSRMCVLAQEADRGKCVKIDYYFCCCWSTNEPTRKDNDRVGHSCWIRSICSCSAHSRVCPCPVFN
jgi:hypothetical protein